MLTGADRLYRQLDRLQEQTDKVLGPPVREERLRDAFTFALFTEAEQERLGALCDQLQPKVKMSWGRVTPGDFTEREKDVILTWIHLELALHTPDEDEAARCRQYLSMGEVDKEAVYAAFLGISEWRFDTYSHISEAPEVRRGEHRDFIWRPAFIFARSCLQQHKALGFPFRYYDVSVMWLWLEAASTRND